MKKPLLILLGLALLVAVVIGQTAYVESPAMARTFMQWCQNPTPETRRAFDHRRHVMEVERLAFSGVIFAVLAGATVLVDRIRTSDPTSPADAESRRCSTKSFLLVLASLALVALVSVLIPCLLQ